MKHDCGILSAATAFGKTVVCSRLIAERKVSTLILLESSALIEQWQKALERFLEFREDFPEYETKTGRKKRRKSVVGIIHGPKDTSTGIVDIAMAGSLCKKGEFHPRLREYGMVLVDECHHSASETLRSVLQEVHAQYVYGVTATPFRGDGLEKINEMLVRQHEPPLPGRRGGQHHAAGKPGGGPGTVGYGITLNRRNQERPQLLRDCS